MKYERGRTKTFVPKASCTVLRASSTGVALVSQCPCELETPAITSNSAGFCGGNLFKNLLPVKVTLVVGLYHLVHSHQCLFDVVGRRRIHHLLLELGCVGIPAFNQRGNTFNDRPLK